MMKFFQFILLLGFLTASAQKNQYPTAFEKGNGNQSATYAQTIGYYRQLDKDFETIRMQEIGFDDSGEPLRMVVFNPDKRFDFSEINKTKAVLLINNGIHPGEPDGIDATMLLFRDLVTGKIKAPRNTVIVAIPVYNIGGALNRNSTTRVNQDGPEQYGFRGNARNYDLNRDLIKSDTKNTKAFAEIFHTIDPDVFIDNHVSDGADYQYVLTYIMTEHNRLGPELGDYFNKEMVPQIVSDLKKKKIEPTPYVNVWDGTPEKGFPQFTDSPRYTTGYTSLFNTLGFVVETHMLKKYPARVKATYEFMVSTLEFTDRNFKKIKEKRAENLASYKAGMKYPIAWETDSAKVETIRFLGYEGSYKKSEVTTGQRLFYDRSKPYDKTIPYNKEFKPVKEITIPKAYVVPKAFWNVIGLLKSNGIAWREIQNDTIIETESYKIAGYQTRKSAYEGHYLHYDTKVEVSKLKIAFVKGDYIFTTDQRGVKYLLETLEPEGVDSFFNWNFFDTVLQQKEGYSDYVFEDLAAEILAENPKLKKELEEKVKSDKTFAENPGAQLDWVYQHSKYREKEYMQYPVYRIVK